MFKYSGNKERLLKYLPAPKSDIIIEPFAGSARYGMFYKPKQLILIEKNPLIYNLWLYLKESTNDRLFELETMVPNYKLDVRKLNLIEPETTLLRLTCASIYTGQLSSWILYPQHRVDFSTIRENLQYLKDSVTIIEGDYNLSLEYSGFFFVDPPYLGTIGHYKSTKERYSRINIGKFKDFLNSLNSYLFTYGNEAPVLFPQENWQIAYTRKVPNIRSGGSVDRIEYYCVKL